MKQQTANFIAYHRDFHHPCLFWLLRKVILTAGDVLFNMNHHRSHWATRRLFQTSNFYFLCLISLHITSFQIWNKAPQFHVSSSFVTVRSNLTMQKQNGRIKGFIVNSKHKKPWSSSLSCVPSSPLLWLLRMDKSRKETTKLARRSSRFLS